MAKLQLNYIFGGVLAAGLLCAAQSDAQVTRGEVADRNAASDVVRCANGYISRGASGMSEPEIWQMCLEGVTDNARRSPSDVRPHVNRIAKKRVL